MWRHPNILYSNLHLDIVPILLINGPNLMKFGNKGLCYFSSISMGTSVFQTSLVAPLFTSIMQFGSLYHKTIFQVVPAKFHFLEEFILKNYEIWLNLAAS